jgi:hypothetical protein
MIELPKYARHIFKIDNIFMAGIQDFFAFSRKVGRSQPAQECCMDIAGLKAAATADPTGHDGAQPPEAARREALRAAAVEFEAVFLAQMLTHAGVGKTPESFGGGVGEDAFRGHLIQEQARLMAESGGIGLAEAIFGMLTETRGETP